MVVVISAVRANLVPRRFVLFADDSEVHACKGLERVVRRRQTGIERWVLDWQVELNNNLDSRALSALKMAVRREDPEK